MSTYTNIEILESQINSVESSKEEFFEDFKSTSDLQRITVFTGGASSGKTTSMKNTIDDLLRKGLISSYASLIESGDYMCRRYTKNNHMEFYNEYALPEHHLRKAIEVKAHNNNIIEAHTDADIVYLPEIRNSKSMVLLDIALRTGKPVFVEIHGQDTKAAVSRILLIEQMYIKELELATEPRELSHFVEIYSFSDPLLSLNKVNSEQLRRPLSTGLFKNVAISQRDHNKKESELMRYTTWEKLLESA